MNAIALILLVLGPVQIVLAGVSAWLSFLAYVEFFEDGGFSPAIAKFSAGVAGVGCGALLIVLYRLICIGYPASPPGRRGLLLIFVAVSAVNIVGFSTYTNVLTSAGGAALALQAGSALAILEAAVAQTQTAAYSISQIGPTLRGQADRLGELANCEEFRGCLTGAPGKGALTDALNSAAGTVGDAAATVERAQGFVSALVGRIGEALANGNAQSVRALISELRGTLPLDSLRQTASTLREGLGLSGTSSIEAIRARQDEAIGQIEHNFLGIADGIAAAVQRIEADLAAVAVPLNETMSKAGAVLEHWDQILPQIFYGVAIDWAPILIALFLTALRDRVPPPDDDASDISVESLHRHIREARRLECALRDGDAKPVRRRRRKSGDDLDQEAEG